MTKNTLDVPFCVSITGADDAVRPADLWELQQLYPFVEWALLFFPEKAATARNPSDAWRNQFLETCAGAKTALHLCGSQVFRGILAGDIPAEFARYGRIQLNINARRPDFTDAEVLAIYQALLDTGHHLILQYHEASRALITDFLQTTPYLERVDVLFDASRGTGKRPDTWPTADQLPVNTSCGYAGGLGPTNVTTVLRQVQGMVNRPANFWLDMESGVRTDNRLDRTKVESVLAQVSRPQA